MSVKASVKYATKYCAECGKPYRTDSGGRRNHQQLYDHQPTPREVPRARP